MTGQWSRATRRWALIVGRQGLAMSPMERALTRSTAPIDAELQEAAACHYGRSSDRWHCPPAKALFKHVSKAGTSSASPVLRQGPLRLGDDLIVRPAARRPGQIIRQGAERLQQLSLGRPAAARRRPESR